jgi:hypothetical protein
MQAEFGRELAAVKNSLEEKADSRYKVRTRILPRWMPLLGYALALILLLSVGTIEWILMVFPLWVLLISTHMLIEYLRGKV